MSASLARTRICPCARNANSVAANTTALGSCIFKHLPQLVGQFCQSRIASERRQLGRSRYKAFPRLGVGYHVLKGKCARPDLADGCRNPNEIVVAGGRMEPHRGLYDRERDIPFFKLGVWCAERANHFGATDLAPDQVV